MQGSEIVEWICEIMSGDLKIGQTVLTLGFATTTRR